MKKWILHILLFASLFSMLTTSCSQDEEIADFPSAGTPSEKVTISFTLDLGEQGGMRSRSSWEGYDEDDKGDSDQAEPGIGDENFIDTNRLQVFMFKTNGTYIGGLKDMEAKRQGDSNIYNIKGEVDVDKSAIVNEVLNCKIMVVANADVASTNNSGAVNGYNNNAIFNHDVTSIPMWGIGTYSINLIQQLQVDLAEPIYMLRSMAKIEVTLNQAVYDEGYRITSATLNKYNTQGYVVPTLPLTTGDSPVVDWNNLTNTTSLSTANVFRENESLAVTASSPTSKSFSANVAGKSYVIYVPEYDNENELTITLGLTHNGTSIYKEGKTPYTISLNEYKINSTTGKSEPDTKRPLDLVRNHWYQYNITSVKTGFDLKLTVVPWEDVTETFNYEDELSYDDGSWINATVTTDEQERETVSLKTAATADATDVTAVYNFNINTPQTIEWMAVLEDPEGKFQFDMSQTSGKGTVEGDNSIQRTVRGELLVTGSNLNLGVKAIDPSESGQYEAILRVYVMYGGKTFELDLTDGEEAALNHFTIQHSKL